MCGVQAKINKSLFHNFFTLTMNIKIGMIFFSLPDLYMVLQRRLTIDFFLVLH